MKVIATIQADLEVTPLGTASRLADDLCGAAVLKRTIDRVRRADLVDAVYVLCPQEQAQRCESLLSGSEVTIRPYKAGPPPWASLVQTGRKWSLDGWRGGIGGTTHFEEFTDGRLISGLLETIEADAVLSVPACAPLIDPGLIDGMIQHHEKTKHESRLTFTQAPPGLAGILMDVSLARELGEKDIPIGWVLSYKPDSPQKDLIFQPCCYEMPPEIRYAVGRLTADTQRSFQRLRALLGEHEDPDLVTAGQWSTRYEDTATEPLPCEVEIELTTDDPYPEALLAPRGSRVEKRGPINLKIVEQLVGELIHFDDALVVLGGFGDPLRHPRFAEALKRIRAVESNGRKLYGLAVRTRGVDLTEEHVEGMINCGVDILELALDAWTPELYTQLQSPNDPARAKLDEVLKRIEQLTQMRQQRQTVKPIVVPSMTKAHDNVRELDDFYDGWIRRLGAVTIHGFSHYAGQLEDRSVIDMAPQPRVGCRRLRSRCVVLADGRVTVCDQDVNGRHAVGSLRDQSLEQIWRSRALDDLRRAHRQGHFDVTPLCATCGEWHRP